jgi:hypothetical protein
MRSVASDNQLLFDKDVKLNTIGTVQKMNKYYDQNPNMTWYGVVWCTTEWVIYENFSIPCHFEYNTGKQMIFYSLLYNASLADNGFLKTFAFP